VLLAPYVPYELVLGIWLVVKGIPSFSDVSPFAQSDIDQAG
jgi:hypothetical protein